MILYNVTISLDASIHQDWLDWMKKTHIPEVMNTGYFTDYQMCKVLVEDEITYAIQYRCKDMKTLNDYQQNCAPQLQKEHNQRYKGKFGAFRTLLEIID
jgi:hypothetical protein